VPPHKKLCESGERKKERSKNNTGGVGKRKRKRKPIILFHTLGRKKGREG